MYAFWQQQNMSVATGFS